MKHLAPLVLIAGLAACGEVPEAGFAPHDTRPWDENVLSKEEPDKLYVFITESGLWDTARMCLRHWKREDERFAALVKDKQMMADIARRFKGRQKECVEFVKTATKTFQVGGYQVTDADTGSIALWDWYQEKWGWIHLCKEKSATVSEMVSCDPLYRR